MTDTFIPDPNQPDLFSITPPTVEAAEERREAGMDLVAGATDPTWAEDAYDMICRYAEVHEFFFVDAWWTWAGERGLDQPPSPRGLGPVVLRAARDGVIRKTGSYAPSTRSNLSPKPIWVCVPYSGSRTGRFGDLVVAA